MKITFTKPKNARKQPPRFPRAYSVTLTGTARDVPMILLHLDEDTMIEIHPESGTIEMVDAHTWGDPSMDFPRYYGKITIDMAEL